MIVPSGDNATGRKILACHARRWPCASKSRGYSTTWRTAKGMPASQWLRNTEGDGCNFLILRYRRDFGGVQPLRAGARCNWKAGQRCPCALHGRPANLLRYQAKRLWGTTAPRQRTCLNEGGRLPCLAAGPRGPGYRRLGNSDSSLSPQDPEGTERDSCLLGPPSPACSSW